jgi:hypothetical protein
MKEIVIAFCTFFITIGTLVLFRVIKRLRKLRKIKGNLLEKGHYLEILEFCAVCCEGACDCGCELCRERIERRTIGEIRVEKATEDKTTVDVDSSELAIDENYAMLSELNEATKRKIITLLEGNQKTSLWWLCNQVKVREEIIVELLATTPGYFIIEGYIYNTFEMTKEEYLAIKEKAELSKEVWRELNLVKEAKEKIAKGICPECNNPLDKNQEYCSSCGIRINNK